MASSNNLQTTAFESGQSQCSRFCRNMNCKSASIMPPPPATVRCAARHPASGQSYGTASTGQFVCECVLE
jgi:hypothetical protein